MKVKIIQKQDKRLLEEHAKSSFNFGILGRNALYLGIAFFIIGIAISWVLYENSLVGIPLIAKGLFDIIKSPSREKMWVKKKEKELLYNKNIEFEILDDTLKINFDKESKTYTFNSMLQCLISETGILFKISSAEQYYISFKSLGSDLSKLDLIKYLKNQFKDGKIKVKRTYNNVFKKWTKH